jgi:hypothetical protein
MDFRAAAAQEASAFVDRLLSRRSDLAVREIRALREALEAAAQAAEAAANMGAAEADDRELAGLIERLVDASAIDVEAAAAGAAAEAQVEIEALRARWEEAEAARARLVTQLGAAQGQIETIHAEALKIKAAAETARSEAQTHKTVAEAAQTEARTYKTAAEAAQTEARIHRAAAEAAQAEVARVTRQLEVQSAERSSTRTEIARLTTQLESTSAEKAAAVAEAAKLTRQAEAYAAEKAKLIAALKQAQQQLVESESRQQAQAARRRDSAPTALDRLSAAFDRLGTASNADQALEALADGLRDQGSRVALFHVRGQTLEGAYQNGFDIETDISKVVIPLTIDSVFNAAITADQVEVFDTSELPEHALLPFGGTPSSGLLVPISVGGEAIAVLYADDGGNGSDGSVAERARIADILRVYAVALLDKLAGDLKALGELRAYAKLLLNEVEHMYDGDVAAGKKAAEIQNRIRENVDCARQIYAQRVEVEGPAAAPLLEEQLMAIVLGQGAMPFGSDLAVAIGQPRAEGKKGVRQSA